MRRKKFWIILIVIIVIFGVSVVLIRARSKNSQPQETYKEYTVTKGTLMDSITVTGTIKSKDVYSVIPLVSGVVKKVYVEEGQRVKKGDLLFEIDDIDYRLSYLQALNDYENVKLNGAKIQIEIAQLELEKAKENLENTKVYAPISGVVTTVNVKEGNRVNTSTNAVRIVDDQNFYVESTIDESDYPNIKLGQHAIIRLTADENQVYNGVLNYIDKQADTSGGLTLIPIKIEIITNTSTSTNATLRRNIFSKLNKIPAATTYGTSTSLNKDNPIFQKMLSNINSKRLELIDGLSCEVEIITLTKPNTLIIPSAVITREDGKTYVLLKTENGPEKREIKLGTSGSNGVEVLEGLNEGDVILLSSSRFSSRTLKNFKFMMPPTKTKIR